MKNNYSIGIDFGTNSVRAALFNTGNGKIVCDSIFGYPTGKDGVVEDSKNPLIARQNPNDYILGLEFTLKDVLQSAVKIDTTFDSNKIISIGVSATGSTPLPIDEFGKSLASHLEFKDDIDAYAWLWKDHSSQKEAELITKIAINSQTNYIKHYSNNYSSEWFWSKISQCQKVNSKVFNKAFTWVELSDFIPALLSGIKDSNEIKRNVCAAGHKAMYHEEWGGLPPADFFSKISQDLGKLRSRMNIQPIESGQEIGTLSKEWANKTGIPEGVSICSGMLDAHCGAIGSGIQYGSLIKIMGTSTCDCVLAKVDNGEPLVNGLSGVVKNSILPNHYGIEAGQSAVGDLFKWFVDNIDNRKNAYEELAAELSTLRPGQSGLIALDWNNGCRNIYSNHKLSGLILGQTLKTTKAEIYLALMEATAFGSKMIFDELVKSNIQINEVICCGGLAIKNKRLMQIYADVIGCEIKTNTASQSCALGAAISATVSAGARKYGYDNYKEAISNMASKAEEVFNPIPENHKIYNQLFSIYKDLADSFATDKVINLSQIMSDLKKFN